jgi:hypothetical protein
LKTDLIHSKKLLEDIIGDQIYGYRAPSFTMNNNILRIIQDCGYLYDSSYNSFNLHDRYSKITLDGIEKKGIAFKFSKNFFELPISNISLKKKHARLHKKRRIYENLIIPWGGGGYFRLVPFKFFKIGVQAILEKENVYLFYLHPWEIDPLQPRIKGAHLSYRFRHYSNQKKTYPKLLALIDHFRSCRFVSCAQYINSQVKANLE